MAKILKPLNKFGKRDSYYGNGLLYTVKYRLFISEKSGAANMKKKINIREGFE